MEKNSSVMNSDLHQLNKTIAAQTELIQSLQKTLEADRLEKETLRQQIEYLTKKLFGTSSEKRKDIEGQLNLFDEAEQEADPTWKPELPDDITVPEHKRKAFSKKNTSWLYLFIERYKKSTIKEIASFAKGLEKDVEAVENAVSSDKSNGFVEGTNNRLKMVKRTMYGRCGRHLLSAKLMYQNNIHT